MDSLAEEGCILWKWEVWVVGGVVITRGAKEATGWLKGRAGDAVRAELRRFSSPYRMCR